MRPPLINIVPIVWAIKPEIFWGSYLNLPRVAPTLAYFELWHDMKLYTHAARCSGFILHYLAVYSCMGHFIIRISDINRLHSICLKSYSYMGYFLLGFSYFYFLNSQVRIVFCLWKCLVINPKLMRLYFLYVTNEIYQINECYVWDSYGSG
jgi:hypothetical protein